MSDRTVGIVGGGMLGMTLALRLAQRGFQVTVVEGAGAVGGLASPARFGEYEWDRFYHVITPSDSTLLDLLGEVGLRDRVRWTRTRTGYYAGGRLHSVSSTREFLAFPVLSLLDKARLAFTMLYASRIRDGRALERIPVATWLRRLSGRRTFERMWLPLLRSKLGEKYQVTNAAFIWATIRRLYRARQSGGKQEKLGYVDGGYATILPAVRAHLERAGVRFRVGKPVERVHDDGEGVELRLADSTTLRFDSVVLTVPCGQVRAACPQLTDAERSRLARVEYLGVVCATLLLRKTLGGYYVTNIADERVPFTGVIEMTGLVPAERFGGLTLVYLPRYLAADDPRWRLTDAQIEAEFVAALLRMYPTLRHDDVVAFSCARAREVLALPTLGYSDEALPAVTTSMPNVFLVNSAQIVNGTLNVNETVQLAESRVDELARRFGPRGRLASAAAVRAAS